MEAEQFKQEKDAEKRRDALLLKLLKTRPQPRPKRERKIEGPSTKPGPSKSRSTKQPQRIKTGSGLEL